MITIKRARQKLIASGSLIKRLTAKQRGIAVVGVLLSIGILTNLNGQVKATSSWIQSSWSGGVGTGTTAQFSSSSNIDYSTGALTLNAPEKLSNTGMESNVSGWSADSSKVIPGTVFGNKNAVASGTSFSITASMAPQGGNTLVLAFTTRTNPGTITLDGWTLDGTSIASTGGGRVYMYRKVVGASESSTVTITTQNSIAAQISLVELTGVDTANPVDQVSTADSGASVVTSLAIPPTGTTTEDNEIAVAAIGVSTSGSTGGASWTDDFTNIGAAADNAFIATKELSSKQTVSTTFSGSTSKLLQGIIITYKGGTSGQMATSNPAVRQSRMETFAATNTVSVPLPASPRAGNTLLLTLNTSSAPGVVTGLSGWTIDANPQAASGSTSIVYRKVATGSEGTSIALSWDNATTGNAVLYEVRGIALQNPKDGQRVFTGVGTAGYTIPDLTTTAAKEFALGAVTVNSSSGIPQDLVNTYGFSDQASTSGGTGGSTGRASYKLLSPIQTLAITLATSSSRSTSGSLTTYFNNGSYAAASRDTSTVHSGSGAAKLVASPWVEKGLFTQSINVGNTQSQNVIAYAKTDGSAITSSVAQLYYDGAAISTTYTSVGNGWYKLSGTVAGVNASKAYGVEVAAQTTIFLDDFSVSSHATPGVLVSSIFDLGYGGSWGNLTYTASGNGTVAVKVRSSNNADMSGAPDFSTCSPVSSGSSLSGTSCMTDNHRYVQYEVTLTSATGAEAPTLDDIAIAYTNYDTTAPTVNADNIVMKKAPSGATVASNAWTNSASPYFSWDAASDNPGGEGVAGYCLYLGTSDTADPVTTKGLLGTSPVNTGGACQFAVSGTSIDLATSGYLQTALTTSDNPYYLNVKAYDTVGNVVGDSASFHFRFDNTAPANPAFVSAPSQFISDKQVTITWPDSGGSAASDGNSGIAGLQYRIGASGTWYGDDHSGTQDSTDLLDNDGNYETVPTPDYDNIVDGNNTVYFRTWDAAGNVSVAYVTAVLKVNINGSPTAPQNVQATPVTNTQNSFAFSWIAPVTYVGTVNNITYCYTVNTVPTEQTCTFTAAGVTTLPAGAYATQPGENTFYVVAKDESGSINYATAASTTFTANTAAPGIPLNLDVADISVKASSNWRLAINWEAPTDLGAGVSSYQVYRSIDNSSFTKVGSTGGTSYTDTSLSQVLYYYKIRACDSANNCGAFTSVASKLPNGKFTTPPNLTAAVNQPSVEDISTTHATIVWATDRACDSKVAFGTVSGTYQATEAYSAEPTTQHRVQINNLSPGKTYYFKAKWTDEDGNTGSSGEVAFKTAPPPVVQDVTTSGITKDSATVQFTTIAASAVKLYYGPSNSFGGAVELNTSLTESKYTVPLKDLKDGTKYFFKINSLDNDNHEYEGTTLSFTTPPAPRISNLRFQPVETEPSSTQKVSWTTNVPTDSRLNYGVIGGTQLNASDGKMVTEHEMTIRNLEDDKQYSLTALSRDAAGDVATSDRQVFQTALDTRPPKVSDVTVEPTVRGSGAEARGQIIVSWTTDEPATSQVAYNSGLATDVYNSRTGEDTAMTTNHVVVVSDLPTSAIYQLQAVSNDKAGNTGTSGGQSTIIGHASDNVLSIVFTALQNIFGFLR